MRLFTHIDARTVDEACSALGKYKGRAPTARAKADKVRELRDAGVRPAEIARQVGISRTSVYRVLG